MDTLLLTAWIVCQSLDIGTTHYALNHPERYQEVNGIIGQSHARLYSVKVGINVGVYLFHRKHKTKIVPIGMAIGGCVPAALNIRTIRRVEK